jgi:parallel beta-helix repeat protein
MRLRRIFSLAIIALLMMSVFLLALAHETQLAKAAGTIYIRTEGNVEPPSAPILNVGNVYYTFTADISDSILVQRDNIMVDGAGHTLQGAGTGKGLWCLEVSNVTITNLTIRQFSYGIYADYSENNSIYSNTITNNTQAIHFTECEYSNISANSVTNNTEGIYFYASDSNSILANSITNNSDGIRFDSGSDGNSISANNITANGGYGIALWLSCDSNKIWHNNFMINTQQAHSDANNIWDDGYPSGGNYWSDYTGTDNNGNGIGDTPYIIDSANIDHYPLMHTFGAGYSPQETVFNATWQGDFNVTWQQETYPVFVATNSTIAGFNFSQPQKQTTFNVTGSSGAKGFCNVTIPKNLLSGDPWTITVNGAPIDFGQTENATHTFIFFTYTFASTIPVVIQGTAVIPESTTTQLLLIIMALSTLAVALGKRKKGDDRRGRHNHSSFLC